MGIKDPQIQSVGDEEHEHEHILSMTGRKQNYYFKFLEALENNDFRGAFEADPQSKLGEFGITCPDLTSEVVTGNLPSIDAVRAYRLALEQDANDNVLQSHAHLMWKYVSGQPPCCPDGSG